MQPIDWDLLRYLLAFRRGGSFAAAARLLNVDDTTVARRIRALERLLNVPLLLRLPAGPALSEQAVRIATRAERMEREVAAAAGAGPADAVGTVRVTAVPILANRLLMPALPGLVAAHPGLTVELLAEGRNLNLSRRDADLALRFAQPERDLYGLWVRRVAMLPYGLFRVAGATGALPLVSYREELAHLPPARWIEQQIKAGFAPRAAIRVGDAETALAAALAGAGIALLPTAVGQSVSGLEGAGGPEPPARPLWLIGHDEMRGLPRVRAVTGWIDRLFRSPAGFRS